MKNIPLVVATLILFILIVSVVSGSKSIMDKVAQTSKVAGTSSGQVAGDATSRVSLQSAQTDTIKKIDDLRYRVSHLKPEDIKDSESVSRIMQDLDELKKEASTSAESWNVRNNVCEQVKERFCSQ